MICAASLLAHRPHTLTEGADTIKCGRCARSLCARARRATPEESFARGASSARGRKARYEKYRHLPLLRRRAFRQAAEAAASPWFRAPAPSPLAPLPSARCARCPAGGVSPLRESSLRSGGGGGALGAAAPPRAMPRTSVPQGRAAPAPASAPVGNPHTKQGVLWPLARPQAPLFPVLSNS